MWPRAINALLGLWLMASPALLGYGNPAATNDRIVGPLVFSFAFIALWDVTRQLRWLNVLLGTWLLVAPWVLAYEMRPFFNSVIVGGLMVPMALIKGRLYHRYGSGWGGLFRRED